MNDDSHFQWWITSTEFSFTNSRREIAEPLAVRCCHITPHSHQRFNSSNWYFPNLLLSSPLLSRHEKAPRSLLFHVGFFMSFLPLRRLIWLEIDIIAVLKGWNRRTMSTEETGQSNKTCQLAALQRPTRLKHWRVLFDGQHKLVKQTLCPVLFSSWWVRPFLGRLLRYKAGFVCWCCNHRLICSSYEQNIQSQYLTVTLRTPPQLDLTSFTQPTHARTLPLTTETFTISR